MSAQTTPSDGTVVVVPATRRPDGTWRKERRVKPGYVPQDEVKTYESRGKQWAKQIPTLPPGYVPDPVKEVKSKTQKRNEKKRLEKEGGEALASGVAALSVSKGGPAAAPPPLSSVEDLERRVKNLRKKLKQIEELEAKAASGATLEKEQVEKISKKAEIASELADIEPRLPK
eukprot:Colp12_sorted_trinity150504_noHs@14099